MNLKIGIIGPTNLEKLSRLTGKSVDFFLGRAKEIGKTLAGMPCELWINSDGGMIAAVGQAYKKNRGKKLVVITPEKGEPWSKKHAMPYERTADELRKERNWFWANYSVVTLTDFCICVGLSAGTLSELAYIKWNYSFDKGNLKKLIAIKELLRGASLPPEIEVDIEEILVYIGNVKDLSAFFSKFLQSISSP